MQTSRNDQNSHIGSRDVDRWPQKAVFGQLLSKCTSNSFELSNGKFFSSV